MFEFIICLAMIRANSRTANPGQPKFFRDRITPQTSTLKHPTSTLKHLTSDIQHLTSHIRHHTSDYQKATSIAAQIFPTASSKSATEWAAETNPTS